MDLHSGAPWWLIRHELLPAVPPLDHSLRTEILVIGAGITGALLADRLSADGRAVVVIDRREPGLGSTAASTALLQYELDVELADLIERRGVEGAVRAYQLCLAAIGRIGALQEELGPIGFEEWPSLYLASRRRHRHRLAKEAALRQRHGLPARFLESGEVEQLHGVRSRGAILSTGAAVDPVALTRRLLDRARTRGARLFGRTEASAWQEGRDGVEVSTTGGGMIRADWVVFAGGYEIENPLRRQLVSLHSSFALVTEPPTDGQWKAPCLIWESARPYTYLRPAGEGRVMVGGGDVPFRNPRLRDRWLPRKTELLQGRLEEVLPYVHYQPAYSWTGTFGETEDGLPFIGPAASRSRLLYALGYGGNGITFSVIAADLLSRMIAGKPDPDREIFALDRA